ncbi:MULTISPECIES: flagellin N-terminal helical domain-containing protein [Paenibacillus]|jgi:flagellin|uniref:flagellin N-terminal helical domain-containing protein n=1 Tax=Paenibacillus TaxID=44249 RepID=UPI0002071D6F|nr:MULTISPECIES: flagellin [Paenibacillus]EGG33898.1 flagellin protein [Paenibacillus sp. HGF5]MCI1774338.1 flagellin [Paenibacillus lautus]VTR39398.1 Flagellin [Actinobacillus pleuropneumoniae]
MRINHNIASYNTQRQLATNNTQQSKSLEKLSSGYRINRAADDAAGLAISEKMRNQIRGLEQASKNALDGISMIQTAEGALNETHAMLQRMGELYTQAANETLTSADSAKIDTEITQLSAQIDSISEQTQFNTKKLLNGDTTDVVFQVGANADETITVTFEAADALTLKVDATSLTALDGTNATAKANMTKVTEAINTVSELRSNLGAVQNRLEHTINNLGTTSENLQAAESRIRDVDMAKEMSEFTKTGILQQAATAMLAQANQQPQGVLQLLR